MVGIGERLKGYLRGREMTYAHQMDHYLMENLPRLAREYELATMANLAPVDAKIDRGKQSVEDLEGWRVRASSRVEQIKKRVARLEVKYGVLAK